MPIIIPRDIPAFSVLQRENVFVMTKKRAYAQDIRPIEIAVLNLMPTKISTETQLMRLLGNSPLQVNITLVQTSTYVSKNTSAAHLDRFYVGFDDLKDKKFDGMIITGAPVETMAFADVAYWDELTKIFDFAHNNVTSTMYICWGAQAGLYYRYGIDKHALPKKLFGVFPHTKVVEFDPLLKGLDEEFYVPHSRHTGIDEEKLHDTDALSVLAYSQKAGPAIIKSKDNKDFFMLGHMEYDRDTLKMEYERDRDKGLAIDPPENYFTDETCDRALMKWSATANLLMSNWLNYYVYQVTPFNIDNIKY